MTTLSDRLIYRRTAPVLMVITFVLAIGAVVGTYVNDQNDRERDRLITKANTDRIMENTANAITQCENANESREAARTLWNFVLDLSSSNPNFDPQRQAYLETVRGYVNEVYAAHDCNDLSRKYPLPSPPAIPGR